MFKEFLKHPKGNKILIQYIYFCMRTYKTIYVLFTILHAYLENPKTCLLVYHLFVIDNYVRYFCLSSLLLQGAIYIQISGTHSVLQHIT